MVMMMWRRKGKNGDRCKKRRVQCNLQGRKGRRGTREIAEEGESYLLSKRQIQIQKTKYKMQSAG